MTGKKLILVKIFMLALMMLFPQNLPAAEKPLTVGMKQSGQQVTVKVGDIIQVELEAQGGTGYSWYLDGLAARCLELVSHETRSAAPAGLVGGPVVHTWRFQAKEAGQTEIKLDYYRQWEGRAKAAKHFLLKVQITPAGP